MRMFGLNFIEEKITFDGKKVILVPVFFDEPVCLSGFTATTALPVIAGGCSSHMNKKAEIKCAEDDTECQIEKAEKFDLRDSLKS